MDKFDLKKEWSRLYHPSSKTVDVVDVPSLSVLSIDGEGDPNSSSMYRDAVEGLFSLAYTLKFSVKKENGVDYVVMPLEGLWWVDDMTTFSEERKDDWKWTMMIVQPGFITPDLVERSRYEATRKKKLASIPLIRFETFHEGRAVQIMHHGAYADEKPNIDRLHRYIQENGYSRSGKHHEIYLNDPRKTVPEKLKTILRQPFL